MEDSIAQHILNELNKKVEIDYCMLNEAEVKQIIVNAYEKATENQVNIIWCLEDVAETAKNRGHKLTITEQRQILKNLERNHDATIGVNWETIESEIDYLLENKESEVKSD